MPYTKDKRKRLRLLVRALKQIPRPELARRIGVTPQCICMQFHGKRRVSDRVYNYIIENFPTEEATCL